MAGVVQAGFGYMESRQAKKAKEAEADQLRLAATARRAAGTHEAYDQRKIGERVASDAIAVMAAGGGQVDSNILADVKTTTDYNVLSALFAAEEEARGLNISARFKEYEGKMAKRFATAKLVTSTIVEGGKALMSAGSAGAGAGAGRHGSMAGSSGAGMYNAPSPTYGM